MTPETRHRLTHIIHAVVTWRGGRVRRADLLSLLCQWARWEGLGVSDAQVKAQFTRPPSRRRRQDCLNCGVDTVAIGEYPYHLRDELWHAIVPSGNGMLCLDCVEVRLGRPLTKTDFHRGLAPRMFKADGSPSQPIVADGSVTNVPMSGSRAID